MYLQFYNWSSPQALLQLYISLARPHLEYASQVYGTLIAERISARLIIAFSIELSYYDYKREL